MNDLQITTGNLPAQPEELAKFILVGAEKAKAIKAEIRAIQKLKLADEVWHQKQHELEMVREAVIEAERRIGVLFNNIPKVSGGDHGNQHTGGKSAEVAVLPKDAVLKTRKEAAEELGFKEREVRRFQQMARHPEAIEQAKAEARETGKELTVDGVLNLIRYKEQKSDDAFYRSIEDDRKHDIYRKAMNALNKIPDDPEAWAAIARSELDPPLERRSLDKEIRKLQGIMNALIKEGDRT